jgi:ABC-type multidrug transport system ATPase subunit
MTGWDYLILFANLFGINSPGKRIEYLMEKVGLHQARNKSVAKYSRGMLQKLSFIRALLHDPDILFLDEPISGLDPIGIKQIRDLILGESREGRTIFTSSHLLSEMEKICHRMAIIHNGRLLVENSVDNLLSGLSGEREISVELDEIPSGLESLINDLQFVINVKVIGKVLIIRIQKNEDFRKELSAFLFSRKCIPLNIHEKQVSLEEAFITITQENIEALTHSGVKNES